MKKFVSRLVRRATRKVSSVVNTSVRREQVRMAAEFSERARHRGCKDFEDLYWYHTVDLGDGLITPGSYDYRQSLPLFGFPEDMRGMSVLDVGSATGFFAFEFERRGADVTSVELPSIADWDRFPGTTLEQALHTVRKHMPSHSLYTAEQIDRIFGAGDPAIINHAILDGPFRFCHNALHSRVQRRYSTVYDLTPARVGRERFDLVFLGDILLHTLYFVKALAAVVPLCNGTLVLAQEMPGSRDDSMPPAQLWVGGRKPGEDEALWWLPNQACLTQVLSKFGFTSVKELGVHSGVLRPGGGAFTRTIIHASR